MMLRFLSFFLAISLAAQTRDAAPRQLLTVGTVGSLPTLCASGMIAFVASAAPGQNIYECPTPNTWVQGRDASMTPVTLFTFTRTPSGTLTASSLATVTLAPVPLGVNGTDVGHSLYIPTCSGGAQTVLIAGGTATAGAASGTITFTPTNSCNAGWTLTSATSGWQEAAQAVGAGGSIYFPAGSYPLRAAFQPPFNGQTYFADDFNAATITSPNGANLQRYVVTGATSDLTFLRLGWEGNFVNQTYTAASVADAIDGTNSIRLRVIGNRFHAFGDQSNLSFPQVLSMYSAHDCQIRDNVFQSNLANEIILNGTLGCAVTNNTFGSPNLGDAKTNVNWWDTYSGGYGTFAANAQRINFQSNRMFGTQRFLSPLTFGQLIEVDGSGSGVSSSDIQIQNNEFHGLGNGIGTVSVTNGSGVVAGLNTSFRSGDATNHNQFRVEGDATVYVITGYTSATSITVTPVIARTTASGLRYLSQNSGDAVNVYNTSGGVITGNSVYDCGDNGYDIGASPAGFFSQHIIFANNLAKNCQVDGLYIGGSQFDLSVTGNLFLDNNRENLTGHRGAIELSPTDQGAQAAQTMWHMTFDANQFVDDQASATQLSAFSIEAGQAANIISNTLGANHYFAFSGGVGLFDTGTTNANIATMFNQTGFSNGLQILPTAFANLGNVNASALANGMLVYCFDCMIANPCAGGGTGALAKRLNGAWVCN